MISLDFEGRKKIDVHLNIAPLIDIVFLLLIFFMLSANFINQTGIKITLPTSKTASHYDDHHIVIYITRDNVLYLNEEVVNLENLQRLLEDQLNTVQDKNVMIKGDEKIDFGLAVKVMDIAKQAKAGGLVISAEFKNDD